MNAFDLDISTTGTEEVIRMLDRLEKKQLNSIFRKALRDGMKIMQAGEKAEAPVGEHGRLKRAIRVRSSRTRRQNRVGINVVLSSKDFPEGKYYGFAVEFGHKQGSIDLGDSRKDVPANPFIKRAFLERKAQALEAIAQSVASQVNELAPGEDE